MIRTVFLFALFTFSTIAGDEWPPPPCKGSSGKFKSKNTQLKKKLLSLKLKFEWPYDFGKKEYASSFL